MENVDFNKRVFTVCLDSENKYYIEENLLADRIRLAAEECTSPKGVMPRLHIVGSSLMWWEVNGHERLIETFDTDEEAEQEWYNRTYEYDYINSDYYYNDCETELDAKIEIAHALTDQDGEERDVEYVEKMLDERLADYHKTAKCICELLFSRLDNEWENAKRCGHMTKNLAKAYDNINFGVHRYNGAEIINVKIIAHEKNATYRKLFDTCGTSLKAEIVDKLLNE